MKRDPEVETELDVIVRALDDPLRIIKGIDLAQYIYSELLIHRHAQLTKQVNHRQAQGLM